jgi:cell surface protein SprA
MSVKNIQIQYSENNGSILPGYLPKTKVFGSENYTPDVNTFGPQKTMQGPGIPFIIGLQNKDFAELMGDQHMLTIDSIMNSPFVMTHSNTLNIRASLEPITDMRVDLNANRSFGENSSRWFVSRNTDPYYSDVNKQITGTFSMSIITAKTAFEAIKKGDYQSESFDQFRNNRIIIADRLAQQRSSYDPSAVDSTTIGYPLGYGRDLQTVLIPAFLAAYTGKSANSISLKENSFEKVFPSFISMRPNWSINYNGLSKLSFLKRWIKTATVTHSYRSTFSIGGYTTSSQYDFNESSDGFSAVRYELQSNFLPKYEINSITINEQFSPLIGLDLTWNNSLITKFEMKKSRTLALGFSNNQLNENKSNEYVIGAGYRIKDVQVTLKAGGKQKNYKSDINIRVDLSIRNSLTLIRKLEEGVTMPTAGQTNITIKTSADYTLSDRFIIKVFFDKTVNNPKISTTYRTSQANFGVSIRFQLVN